MKAKKAKEYIFTDPLGMEAYCQSHYAEYYSKSNLSCNITQLSRGELLTSSICAPINNVHLEVLSQTKPSSTKKTPIKIQLHFAGLINLINCLLLIQLLAGTRCAI